MTPEQAEEQVRQDAADRMQHNTTADLSARLMCRVGFRELTLLLAHYDGLKRAHAASLAPAVPEGWEPIETAPRDGTAILAASVNHDAQEVVCWQDGAPTGSFAEVEEGWVNSGPTKDRFYANPLWFTHWRPISARPLPTEGEAGRAALEAEKTGGAA